MTGKIRIIGGQWRGRRLIVPDRPGLRPTGDRVRETLFNWLAPHLVGASCLDLFAGTGALGLEAASRGAGRVVMIERDRQLAGLVGQVAASWPGGEVIEVICADALAWIGLGDETFDIALIDPPFGAGLQGRVLEALAAHRRLADAALVYVELDIDEPLPDDGRFEVLRNKRLGRVRALLLRLVQDQPV